MTFNPQNPLIVLGTENLASWKVIGGWCCCEVVTGDMFLVRYFRGVNECNNQSALQQKIGSRVFSPLVLHIFLCSGRSGTAWTRMTTNFT